MQPQFQVGAHATAWNWDRQALRCPSHHPNGTNNHGLMHTGGSLPTSGGFTPLDRCKAHILARASYSFSFRGRPLRWTTSDLIHSRHRLHNQRSWFPEYVCLDHLEGLQCAKGGVVGTPDRLETYSAPIEAQPTSSRDTLSW